MNAAMTSVFPRRSRRQEGFTLIELMVAITIGLVVVLGMSASFVSMKRSFTSQSSMSQLQDNERLAMTILSTSVAEAGFFPNGANLNAVPALPIQNTSRTAALVASSDTIGGAMVAGQYLFGQVASGTTPESLSTAYASASGDGLLSCQGGLNTSSTATVSIRNTFWVDSATGTLMCSVMVNGGTTVAPASTQQPLISGVSGMTVLYGEDSDGDGNVDLYKTADKITTAVEWGTVKNVQVTLSFANPNNSTLPIAWTQAINVMNNK